MALPAEQIVGRAAELESLETVLAELPRDGSAVLEIVGEPGIGKTTLLEELGARADARGWLVLAGSASELEGDLPFGVFVDALDEYVSGLEPRRLDGMDEDVRAELPFVLPSLPATRPPSGGLQIERYRTHRAVRSLLEALAQRKPLVLLLDDLHWADPGSIELLGALLRRPPAAPVLIAAAVRPRQLPERLAAALTRAPAMTRIDVGGLGMDEARELVGATEAETFYEQCGGNPFYLRELARFPDAPSVGAALGEELSLLDARARRVVEGAAVSGDPFEPELAAAAADVPEPEVVDRLDELCAATSSAPPTCRAGSGSATRSCGRRSTRPRLEGGGSAPTSAPPRRWRRAGRPPSRAPTTSSTRRATATLRRSLCCAKRARRSPSALPRAPRAGSPPLSGCSPTRRPERSASPCWRRSPPRMPPPGASRTRMPRCSSAFGSLTRAANGS